MIKNKKEQEGLPNQESNNNYQEWEIVLIPNHQNNPKQKENKNPEESWIEDVTEDPSAPQGFIM